MSRRNHSRHSSAEKIPKFYGTKNTIKGTHNNHTRPIPKLTCTYFIYLYGKTSRIAHRIFTSRSEDPVDKVVYGKKSLVPGYNILAYRKGNEQTTQSPSYPKRRS